MLLAFLDAFQRRGSLGEVRRIQRRGGIGQSCFRGRTRVSSSAPEDGESRASKLSKGKRNREGSEGGVSKKKKVVFIADESASREKGCAASEGRIQKHAN